MRHSPRSLRHVQITDANLGWQPGEGPVLLRQARMGVSIHRVLWEQEGKPLYDQPLIVEPSGALCLPIDRVTGRIGLVQAQRPLARDLSAYNAKVPDLDPGNLGVLTWECPRGLPKIGQTERQAAADEGEEETGGRVLSVESLLIRASLNSTYFPQTIGCYVLEVDMSRPALTVDPNEGIVGKATFFSLREFVALQEAGDCFDVAAGYIVSYLMIRRPGLLK